MSETEKTRIRVLKPAGKGRRMVSSTQEQQGQQDGKAPAFELGKLPGGAGGSRLTAMRPPSSGGRGSRFKTISTPLMPMPTSRHFLQASE
jgi:hypothetical protein